MPKTLQLIIEPPGAVTPISVHVVDESVTIGAFVAQLSVQLGYPNTDGRGAPVAYQLRPAGSNTPLHGHQKFAEVGIPSGTRLVLERVVSPRRWSRRFVLTAATTLFGFAVTGLLAGFAASVANASIRRRSLAAAPLTPAQPARSQAVVAPRTATVQGTFSAHQQTVRVVTWSPDGTRLASGGDDGLLLVWTAPGMVLSRVQHPAPVQALAWSLEGQRIVTGSATEVRFFTALTGALLASSAHQHSALVTSLAWTPHQQMHVVSGSADRRAII